MDVTSNLMRANRTFTYAVAGREFVGVAEYDRPGGVEAQVNISLSSKAGEKVSILFHCNSHLERYEEFDALPADALIEIALERLELDTIKKYVSSHIGQNSTLLFRFNEPKLLDA